MGLFKIFNFTVLWEIIIVLNIYAYIYVMYSTYCDLHTLGVQVWKYIFLCVVNCTKTILGHLR